MEINITTLIENSLGEHTGLAVEHGLSFLVESGPHSVLFDTGQSDRYIRNAEKLGKELSSVRNVVLSHGHYDHSGGFRSFVEKRGKGTLTLWTGKGFFDQKYGKSGPSLQYLGNDFDEDFLNSHAVEHRTVASGKTEVVPGIWIVSGYSRIHPEEPVNPRFCKRIALDGSFQEDTFEDEILLVVESKRGLVVIVGCAHPGILNMLDTVATLFNQKVYALLGGTHLVEADQKRIGDTLKIFQEMDISVLGISHCSGSAAIEQSISMMDLSFHNNTGTSIILRDDEI
ncbi:metal-dependent hydrolase, beta-lactamase superfamily II [Sphaerochaeta pleomorpha str. Grapes]|uniref:Metal-dependent hydrolase, beta-lactamase superfamily II n=1 Tax=Sphaerochaeta pleomorpha (strain ATCC BAA-1885 / DSM 22778 / Grapes) TaxID=158190 RepID=G8QQG6_SPHPG|nr:MBL fold metallo-hydrolase [Sphaerochaeta pleomorpha]AEV29811.1 metal-dependent hydrolase, beta-lactamase superfamily II [Sphaerochaeta pleomorpha str. Grapes]